MPFKSNAAERDWYKRNKKKRYRLNRAHKIKVKNWLKEYKKTLSCARCSENHPACLDFHHVVGKKMSVSVMAHAGWSIENVKLEISKCIVLCSNCHRKGHRKEYASVAQTAERLTCNEDVAGATPAPSSILNPVLV